MASIKDRIECVRNETFPSNSYILPDPKGKVCLLIDPGLDHDLIDHKLVETRYRPIAILATHGHFDHIGSVAFFKEKYKVPAYMHEADLKLSKSANFYIKMAKLKAIIETPVFDVLWTGQQEKLTVGPFDLSIYNFPGHSYGSCVIQYQDCLFSGDIMYKNGLGFNNFPGEDRQKLRDSILKIFDQFDEGSLILPGHGQREYLGAIRTNNLELKGFLSKSTEQ